MASKAAEASQAAGLPKATPAAEPSTSSAAPAIKAAPHATPAGEHANSVAASAGEQANSNTAPAGVSPSEDMAGSRAEAAEADIPPPKTKAPPVAAVKGDWDSAPAEPFLAPGSPSASGLPQQEDSIAGVPQARYL